MIFSELYGAYYTTVSKIISASINKSLTKEEIRSIIEKYAFSESVINIESAISKERWQIITKEGNTPIKNDPSIPLTTLQKRWLKAISSDPRIKLFGDIFPELEGIDPLFKEEDICIFDKYADGDPYSNEEYITNFQLILDAINNRYPLRIAMQNKSGRAIYVVLMPEYLEYSEKDDKFRLIGSGRKYADVINLARIISCKPYTKEYISRPYTRMSNGQSTIEFELNDERNALERVLMHFAHLEKQAEKIGNNQYRVKLIYDKDDETELLIRILSFGPMIKVVSPDSFVRLIKERLMKQKSCEQ